MSIKMPYWPKEGIELFESSGSYYELAHFGWGNSETKFYGYIMGYKNAADILVSNVKRKKDISFTDTVIYPIIFLYRQFIELSLKKIYFSYSHDTLKDKIKSIKEANHNLVRIWRIIKPRLLEYSSVNEKVDIENVEAYIVQYQDIDPNSVIYRYPIDKKLNTTIQNEKRLNLVKLSERIHELESFFNGVEGKLSDILDFESEMYQYFGETQ